MWPHYDASTTLVVQACLRQHLLANVYIGICKIDSDFTIESQFFANCFMFYGDVIRSALNIGLRGSYCGIIKSRGCGL